MKDPVREALAQALWAPRSVALVGASEGNQKHTALPLQFLERHGYGGDIFPVNPHREQVYGRRSFPSIAAIGRPVDHAIIMVPTESAADVVAECSAQGVRCVTILSDGFAERGAAGLERQHRLVSQARANGLRILGPNSIGLVNPHGRLALSANEVLSLPRLLPGRVGLISQSGSMIGALLSRGQARGFGFSKLVSVGNEADLDTAEIGELLIEDPETDALLLFLETIRRPEALATMAARAHSVGKPVIAFRLGRTAVVEEIAASHTGAMVGSSAAMESFLRDIGAICIDQLETLLEIPALVIGRNPPDGRRAAVVTTTGGGAALVIDKLPAGEVEIVPPSAAVIEDLAKQDITIAAKPLIDLTLAGTNARTYGAVLQSLLRSDHCDLVISVVGSSSQFRPDRAVAPIKAAAALASKPLAAFLAPHAEQSLALLRDSGIAAFRTPEACADAVRAYLAWRRPRDRNVPELQLDEAGRSTLRTAISQDNPQAVVDLLATLAIPRPQEVLMPPSCGPLPQALLQGLRYPVVAKVASKDITHKTEVGGVALGIGSPAELQQACNRIFASVNRCAPTAKVQGIRVQSHESGLCEAILGYHLDPAVGPTITLGVGGVLAEIYRDFAVRPAPVSLETALEMITEVRGLQVIRGYRNLPHGDLTALAQCVAALSRLASLESPRVLEAEINPLLVKREGEGVVSLDELLLLEEDP